MSGSLKDKLNKIAAKNIIGEFYRLVSKKHSNEMLSTKGSYAYGGRYNTQGEFGVLYLGDSPEICIAEREKKVKSSQYVTQIIGTVKIEGNNLIIFDKAKKNLKIKVVKKRES